MMEPPGVDATQEELDAYKEWLLLVHEEKKPVTAAGGSSTGASSAGGGGGQQAGTGAETGNSLLPQHARLLLQRLAAFFHDAEMHTLWVLAAKTVMEFTASPASDDNRSPAAPLSGGGGGGGGGGSSSASSSDLMETAAMAREAGIDALEHTLCNAPSAVVANIAAKALQVLNAQSDALSSHLVTQLGNWPIEEGTILGALTLLDAPVLHQLLLYAAVRSCPHAHTDLDCGAFARACAFDQMSCESDHLPFWLAAVLCLRVARRLPVATQRRSDAPSARGRRPLQSSPR